VTLDGIELGQSVSISQINTLHTNTKRRLLSMGFTPGAFLKVIGITPFQGAIQIKIRGYYIAIRRSDASNIEVFPA
jgi:Fe2+ transport system protein FeoA